MEAPDRPIVWLKGQIKSPPFGREARVEAGVLLRLLQRGEKLGLPKSRPMPVIGKGCHELRIIDRETTWRIILCVERDAIVILEVFAKKTEQTPRRVVDTSRRRLSAYRAID